MIHTERCLASPLSLDHLDSIFALYKNKSVQQYLGGTLNDKCAFETRFHEILNNQKALNWAIHLKEGRRAFIGMIVVGVHHNQKDYEVSFKFMPDFWGLGLACETISACIAEAKSQLNLESIVAETQVTNDRTRRLLEKLSMHSEKTLTRFNETQVFYRKIF